MVNTLRTARLPADMVAVEQDAAAATTEEMIAREQKRQAQLKEIEVKANKAHLKLLHMGGKLCLVF